MGKNGSGKTHILDAVHLLGWSVSFYTHAPIDPDTRFEGVFEEDSLAKHYTLFQNQKSTQYSIQWAKITKPKYLQALPFRTVFVSPFDMNLLYFAPNIRREYIDNILERAYEQFPKVRRDYERVMRQRNALLKKVREGEAKREDLGFWDAKFAECADTYLLYRKKYIQFIEQHLSDIQQSLPKYELHFSYQSSVEEKHVAYSQEDLSTLWTDETVILSYLNKNRERDIITGHTHIGPHRDDFGFCIETPQGKVSADTYLSRGEMKMLLLSIKKLEVKFIEQHIDVPILLLVDDIFAELDEANIVRFLNWLTTYQTILTSQKPLPDGENWSDFICINLKDT